MRRLLPAILLALTPLHAAEKPNVIYILSDDLGMGELGCYGQKLIHTPNLDRMAAGGTRFTQAYTGTSVCAPARVSLMTGLDMGHSPIRANGEVKPEGQRPIAAELLTVAEVFKRAGYSTACTGKWGMGMFATEGSPLKQGFDRFYGYNCQRHAHSYYPQYLYDNDRRIELDGKTYAADLIHREALAFVRDHKDGPFFLYYSTTLPHAVLEIDDLGIYQDKPWSGKEKTYAAMVSRLDRHVGEILNLLEELKIDRKTLVIFTGDNGTDHAKGTPIGERFDLSMGGSIRGIKRTLYEGGLRQPAIASWPGVVPAGRVADGPWAFWDFLPTAAELAGVPLSGTEKSVTQGHSLVSYWKGGKPPERESFYWELHEGAPKQAVRFGDWKAVRNRPGTAIELYDLKSDAAESNDVAAGHADIVRRAETLMKQCRVDHPLWPLAVREKAGKNGTNKMTGTKP